MKTIFTLFITLISTIIASAQMLPVKDAELIRTSEQIVEAEVLSKECRWVDNHQAIYTFVKIKVTDPIKSSTNIGDELTIVVPGGKAPDQDLTMHVSNQPEFTQGEKAILYLNKAKGYVDAINYDVLRNEFVNFSEFKRVNNLFQGKHDIIINKKGEKMVVKPNQNKIVPLNSHKNQLKYEIKIHKK